MSKFDLSDIQSKGHRVNKLRLFHSRSMRPGLVDKMRQAYEAQDDLGRERKLMVDFLIEDCEICLTRYYLFSVLKYLFLGLMMVSIVLNAGGSILPAILIVIALASWWLEVKCKDDFLMGGVAVSFTESIYDEKINEKYNLK